MNRPKKRTPKAPSRASVALTDPPTPPEAVPKPAGAPTARPRYRASSVFRHPGGAFFSEHGFWPPKPEPAQIPLDSQKTNRPTQQKGGRPRNDEERKRIRELKAKGMTWKEITTEMNKASGKSKSVEAYRSLLRSGSPHPKQV